MVVRLWDETAFALVLLHSCPGKNAICRGERVLASSKETTVDRWPWFARLLLLLSLSISMSLSLLPPLEVVPHIYLLLWLTLAYPAHTAACENLLWTSVEPNNFLSLHPVSQRRRLVPLYS